MSSPVRILVATTIAAVSLVGVSVAGISTAMIAIRVSQEAVETGEEPGLDDEDRYPHRLSAA